MKLALHTQVVGAHDTQLGARDIYLDNNATTMPLPQVAAVIANAVSTEYGNPASAHSRGRAARQAVELARGHIAELVGANPEELVFTSGGTEANNLALNCAHAGGCHRIVTTNVEHPSVLAKSMALRESGVNVIELPVSADGLISLEDLEEALEQPTDLVSVHWANSETGVIQPINDIATVCGNVEVPLHVDAVQAVGRVPVSFSANPISLMSLTAHKIHGPQGIGALCTKAELKGWNPIMYGGDQERGLRPGTHNLPGIVGFGKAAEVRSSTLEPSLSHMLDLRDRFEKLVREALPWVAINGGAATRVCNTSNLRFAGVDGMALMARLDGSGIACSQSSACRSMSPEPSHVLQAMGLSEDDAFSSIRFSFSVLNTMDEAEMAAERVIDHARQLRPSSH